MKIFLAFVWLGFGVLSTGLNNAADNHMFCSRDSRWGGRANVGYMACNGGRHIVPFAILFGPITLINYLITYPNDHDGWSLARGKPGQ